MTRLPSRGRYARGFTTVDLLATVVIVGILAVLGVVALTKQVRSARTVEVLGMMQSIRAAEEIWRSENMAYLNVSVQDTWYPVDPAISGNGRMKRSFYEDSGSSGNDDNSRWLMLNPRTNGPVQFGYVCNAGLSGTPMTNPLFPLPGFSWPSPVTEPWYVIQARGDVDGDTEPSHYMMSSLNNEVFSLDEGE